MTDREYRQATATDRYISYRQQPPQLPQAGASPPILDAADATVVDALHQLAMTTTADPAFVMQLAAQLEAQPLPVAPQPGPTKAAVSDAQAPWWVRFSWLVAPRRLVSALATLLLIAAVGVIATPAARATVWDLLYGFGLVSEATVSNESVPAVLPTQAPDATAALDLAAITAAASFAVPVPQWLPAELRLTGGFVETTAAGDQVTLAYHLTDPPAAGYPLDAPLLFLVISEGPIDHRPLIAEEWLTPLRVGKTIGMYAHGDWAGDVTTTAAETITGLQWDSAADATWLTWQQDGLNLLLYTQGLGADRATTVKIAESMAPATAP